jgi:hypothetical protein
MMGYWVDNEKVKEIVAELDKKLSAKASKNSLE